MDRVIEICCGSYYDALMAYKGGAKRIELNSALYLGGLTPTLASLIMTKENTDLKVICMVRPRSAGFCYLDEDYEVMLRDAELLLKNGADGIAFGFLDENSEIDETRTKEMVKIIRKYNGEAVFHRAFDCVNDPYKSIEKLIDLKIDRILTSGLRAKAMDGIDLIKDLQAKYGERIELLAGSGMNASNALSMILYTGISQVHSSCKDYLVDNTTSGKEVSYSYLSDSHQNDYDVVSEELVRKLVQSV